jgi:hypothetical protein
MAWRAPRPVVIKLSGKRKNDAEIKAYAAEITEKIAWGSILEISKGLKDIHNAI